MPDPIQLTVQENDAPIPISPEQAVIIKAVSPTVTTEQVTCGALIIITDVDGQHTVRLYDGANGEDGRGISSTVLNADYTLTITYTDGTSFTTPSIRGDRGSGITSIEKTSTSGLVDTYTITYGDGYTSTFNVTNGKDGDPGVGVPSGGTTKQILTKVSDTDYDTQWTDKNPVVQVSGTTPAITAVDGTRYICGEVATLDITLPDSGIVDVVFQSGSTATVLTITPPTGKTLSWANGFDHTALEANTTYELNIAVVGDKCLGVTGVWT